MNYLYKGGGGGGYQKRTKHDVSTWMGVGREGATSFVIGGLCDGRGQQGSGIGWGEYKGRVGRAAMVKSKVEKLKRLLKKEKGKGGVLCVCVCVHRWGES